jgi:hypothetical protein
VFRTLLFATVMLFLGVNVAFAQSADQSDELTGDQGLLNAVRYRPLPTDAVIEVQALDNSDENLELVAELSRALRQLGYTIADEGTLIMTIETRDEIGAWSTSGDGGNISFQTQQGSGGTDSMDLRVNLFDSNTGGLMSNSQSNPTTIVTPSRYVVDITVDSRENGKRLWQGWISTNLGQTQTYNQTLMQRMIPALASAYGQTINKQIVTLP